MRSLTIAPAILLLCGALAAAEPDITILPREPSAKPIDLKAVKGQVITLSAGKAKAAKWMLIDAAGADLVPTGLTAAFTASADGSYRVAVAADGELVLVVVNVGGSPPVPVPPKPDPDTPPVPDSPLKKKIWDAYKDDGSPKKRGYAKDLAAVYRQAAILVMDKNITDNDELIRQIKNASKKMVDDQLVPVREAVSEELSLIIGYPGEITPEQRTAAAKLFTELAAILDSF